MAVGPAGSNLLRRTPSAEVLRFSVGPPDGHPFATIPEFLSVSPDGRKLAFITGGFRPDNRLWVRSFDSLTSEEIADTEGGLNPVWSPDGRFIALSKSLVTSAPGRLQKIDLAGGAPLTLAEAGVAGAWSQEGIVLFRGRDGRIYRVAESGGDVAPVTEIDSTREEARHVPRFFLSDGRQFVFEAHGKDGARSTVYVGSLDSPSRTRVLEGLSNVAYATGHLLFQRGGVLTMQPFDIERGQMTGEATPVIENIDYDARFGRAAFSVSSNGVLVYRTSVDVASSQLTWFDFKGTALGSPALGGDYQRARRPSVSPDGRYLAVTRAEGQGASDVWLIDLERDVPTRFTFDAAAETPLWSPDGQRIVFTSSRKGSGDLYQRDSTGAGEEELLYESPDHKQAQAFSPDGKVLLFGQGSEDNPEIWALPMVGDRTPVPVVRTGFPAGNAVFAPDGRWFAYCEGDSYGSRSDIAVGRDQVYVQPYPPNGTRTRLSTTNGSSPYWSTDGKTIVYTTADDRIMVVDVATAGGVLRAGVPRELFQAPATFVHRAVLFDSPRSRLLLPITRQAVVAPPITVVVNWLEGLKRRNAAR